jgi:hypothetical protein
MAYIIALPDGNTVEFPDSVPQDKAAEILKKQFPEFGAKEVGIGDYPRVLGSSLLSGIGGLAQLPGQIKGLIQGDFSSNPLFINQAQKLQEYGESLKPEGLKTRQAIRDKATEEAAKKGFVSELTTAAGQTLTDPALATSFLAEQLPQQLPAILAGIFGPEASAGVAAARMAAKKAVGELAKKKAEEEAIKQGIKVGARAAVGTGAVQQGADVGAQTYKELYDALIEQDVKPEQAAAGAINAARAAGASGAIISILAQNLPGAQAMEKAIIGKTLGQKGTGIGRITGAGIGALKEIPSEMVEEGGGKFTQNLAMREVNPDQPLMQGVGTAAGLAAAGAGLMGGTVGALTNKKTPPTNINLTNVPATEEEAPAQPVGPTRTTAELLAEEEAAKEEAAKEEVAKEIPITKQVAPPKGSIEELQATIEKTKQDLTKQQNDIDTGAYKSPSHLASKKKIVNDLTRDLTSYEETLAKRLATGETNAEQPISAENGAGAGVPSGTDTNAPSTEGATGSTTDGVVPAGENVPSAIAGEEQPAVALTPKPGIVNQLAREEQKKAGWNEDWPFIPADLGNADFRKLIAEDPSISEEEKIKIFEAGKKLGVVPKNEQTKKGETTSVIETPQAKQAEEKGQEAPPAAAPSINPPKAEITKEIRAIEGEIGKRYDSDRDLSRFADDQSVNLYEATSKGMLPNDQQLGSSRLKATLDANGLTEPELSDDYDDMSPADKEKERKRVIDEIATQLESKRSVLPDWDSLTRDAKDVFLANMKNNTPAQREKAREALVSYLKKVKEVQGTSTEVKAAPEAGIYERNRQAYKAKDRLEYPTWDQLNDTQRKIYNDKLAELAPKNKKGVTQINKASAEHHDAAFKAVADNLLTEGYIPKPGMTYSDVRSMQLKQSEKTSLERAQKEIESESDTKAVQEEMRKESEAALNKTLPSQKPKFLPESLIKNIKEGNFGALLNYFTSVVKDKSYRAIAKEIQKLGLKTKIKIVDKLPRGDIAVYDPKVDTILTTAEGLQDETMMHEVVHAATTNVIYKYLNYVKKGKKTGGLTLEQIDAAEHLEDIMEAAREELGAVYPEAFKDLYEFVSYAMTNKSFQDMLRESDTSKLSSTMIPESKSLWSEFMTSVIKTLGQLKDFFKGNKPLDTLDNLFVETTAAFEKILSPTPEEGLNLKALPTAQVKQATPVVERNFNQLVEQQILPEKASVSKIKNYITSTTGLIKFATLFANNRFPIKFWQDALDRAGKIVVEGSKLNNVYTQIALAGGTAKFLYSKFISNPYGDLQNSIGEYVEATGGDVDVALKKLNLFMSAFHEGERRDVKYMMNVPLNTDVVQNLAGTGLNISPANFRDKVLAKVESGTLRDQQEAINLRKDLDAVVAKYADPTGNSPTGYTSVDRNSADYNVIGKMTSVEVETVKKNADHPEIVDKIRKAIQKLHKSTIELNKQSNYWSKPVQDVVNFYGWKDYVPFKGKTNASVGANDDLLNFDSRRRGGDLQEGQNPFGGRETFSDNVLIQTLSDSVRSATRAGMKNLTLSIKNAVTPDANGNRLLDGEVYKTIPFSEKSTVDLNELKGENVIFHYNENGTIDIIKINDTPKLEAIRKTYQETNPIVKQLNNFTSTVGMFHTRYNMAFGPVNFVRDALTNAFYIGISKGAGASVDYLGNIAMKVANGGLYKVNQIARLYNNGDVEGIEALAKNDKSGYVKDMLEYLERGGMVSFLDGLTVKGGYNNLKNELTSSNIEVAKKAVNKFFDGYMDSFELASRTAAYKTMKEQYLREGMSQEAAKTRATDYVKGLANFEQVGNWGKEMGAVFMFFRPAATGAVRAIEALGPMLRSTDTAVNDLPEHVRNDKNAVALFRQSHERQREAAKGMSMALSGIGVAFYMLAFAGADDDDLGRNKVATDDINRWTRYGRIFIPGMKEPLQIPWGYGMGAFAASGAQVAAMMMGHASIKDGFNNILEIGMDSFLPLPQSRINKFDNFPAWLMDSATPSILRPFFEFQMNMDGLGRKIYSDRRSGTVDAYAAGNNIPELWKDAARILYRITDGAVNITPNTLYFFANNYADGITRLAQDGHGFATWATGQKEFNPRTDTIVFDSFFGAPSNYDSRQFSALESQAEEMSQIISTLPTADPEMFERLVEAKPEMLAIVKDYNKTVGGSLKNLRELAKKINRMPDLSYKDRKEAIDDITQGENLIKYAFTERMKEYGLKP